MEIVKFTNVSNLRGIVANYENEEYVCVQIGNREVIPDKWCISRMIDIANQIGAGLLYSDYRELQSDGSSIMHPCIDYLPGSLRDDFDFGSLIVLNINDVLNASSDFGEPEDKMPDGGLYALRLRLSIGSNFVHVPECLYSVQRIDYRDSGEKQHDYVDPRNRDYQIAMEKVLTNHLFEIDALAPREKEIVDLDSYKFDVEASVIIPVKNRVKTIGDAVKSALGQVATFNYNVIVVDNGSSDGTRQILEAIDDDRLIIIKLNGDEGYGIGGCWNLAVLNENCGRFAVQLDSDDVYSGNDTLQKIVDLFKKEKCAMVIGSYMMTDFNLNPIPPGKIDHAEWTDDNGANNALRINGLGAPRAFFTPILRENLLPNTSYGEDYAIGLRLSRNYRIGRIYEVIYNCRRWEGNSDAALPIQKVNANNFYKDFIRTTEYLARIRINNEQKC